MPQATSTFSMPRRSSPRASASVLPFSVVISRAISSKCSSSSCLNRNRYWMRSAGGVAAPVRAGRRGGLTAASTSASPARRRHAEHLAGGRIEHFQPRAGKRPAPVAADVVQDRCCHRRSSAFRVDLVPAFSLHRALVVRARLRARPRSRTPRRSARPTTTRSPARALPCPPRPRPRMVLVSGRACRQRLLQFLVRRRADRLARRARRTAPRSPPGRSRRRAGRCRSGSGSSCRSRPSRSTRDRPPMLAKPWLSSSTMVSLSPSCTDVTISDDIIRYEPSPTIT